MMKTRSSGAEGESRSVVRRSPDYPYKKSSSVISSRNRGPPGLRPLMTTHSLQGDSGSSPKRGVLSTLKRRTMILFSKMTVLLVLLTLSSCCNATGSFTLKEATDLGFSILKKDPKCGENGTYFNIHSTGVPQEHATRVFRHNMAWTMEKSRRQTIALLAGPQMPITGLMDGVDCSISSHGGPSTSAIQEAIQNVETRTSQPLNESAKVTSKCGESTQVPDEAAPSKVTCTCTDTEGEDEDEKHWDFQNPMNQTYDISINNASREKILRIRLQSQQRDLAAAQNESQREEAQRKVDETLADLERHERKQAQKLRDVETREDPDPEAEKLAKNQRGSNRETMKTIKQIQDARYYSDVEGFQEANYKISKIRFNNDQEKCREADERFRKLRANPEL